MDNIISSRTAGGEYREMPPINLGLSEDALDYILHQLDITDLQSASMVCKFWNNVSIKTASKAEHSMIMDFSNFLVTKLNPEKYGDQIESLNTMRSDTKILNCVNLIQVKSSMIDTKKAIIKVLMDLSKEDLDAMKELCQNRRMPRDFENIFTLVPIYKQIEEANKITDEIERSFSLENCVKLLARAGDFAKASEVANSIPRPLSQVRAIEYIVREMFYIGNIEKAVILAWLSEYGELKFTLLKELVPVLIAQDNFEAAITIAYLFPKESPERENLLIFIEKAKLTPNTFLKKEFSEVLLKRGYLDKAADIAFSMKNDENNLKSKTYAAISEAWEKHGNFTMAITIAQLIPDDEIRTRVVQHLEEVSAASG